MKFGSWIFPISQQIKNDGKVIADSLQEIDTWEKLGFDAVWLSEHHFDGATAYADPIVFASAIAQRTQTVSIGFAVVEMALHHPVRLAVQIALLDHLSNGRIILGTGKGSAFNEYEYIGFGVPMSQGADSINEAEELILQSWSGNPVNFSGKYWNLSFPELRPQPLQKPHPPIVRACLSIDSTIEMAKLNRPILIAGQKNSLIKERIDIYTSTLYSSGINDKTADNILDQIWVNKNIVVAESSEEALEIAYIGYQTEQNHFKKARDSYNPSAASSSISKPASISKEDFENLFIVGNPKQVIDQIAELESIGVRNLMLKINTGEMKQSTVFNTMELLAKHIKPIF
jgi:alkanesulfonate monooxygenase SsuD/methylene tetrahydromethanopterin reductase-like flavin-dependent oxidoreductase (luciferase family)